MAHENRLRDEAVAWAMRTGDPAFEDWDAFTAWLEQSPAHAAAYDQVAGAALDAAEALAATPQPGNDNSPVADPALASPPRRRFLAGAMAAALAGVAILSVFQMRGGSYVVETAPGETRVLALEGGVEIALAGGTRLLLERDDPRSASLEHGQALFTVEHDPAAPYRLQVGDDRLVDLGTVFDVRHDAGSVSVEVSEGEVLFNPDRQRVTVRPGQRLTSVAGSDEYVVEAVPLAEVGEWLEGRLTFRDATLGQVAADLSAATGRNFTVSPGAAGQTVSGSLLLDGVEADPRGIGPLLGVPVRYRAGAWELGGS